MTCQNRPFLAPGQGSCFRFRCRHDHFWFRLPSKLLVVSQWNLVCGFVMVIPRDIFKDFWKFWFFLDFCCFSKKTDRNFWFRLPSKLLVVPQGNLVCSFVMVIPRDIFKDFWIFWFFFICAVFPKKQIEIFGPAYHLNDLLHLYETWYAALLWQYFGIFSRIFWDFDFLLFSKKKTVSNFWPHVPPKLFVKGLWNMVCCFIMAINL